ncbi:hypothetical protein H0H92_000701, partial [Tricholoma furcatifolium]
KLATHNKIELKKDQGVSPFELQKRQGFGGDSPRRDRPGPKARIFPTKAMTPEDHALLEDFGTTIIDLAI